MWLYFGSFKDSLVLEMQKSPALVSQTLRPPSRATHTPDPSLGVHFVCVCCRWKTENPLCPALKSHAVQHIKFTHSQVLRMSSPG